ncbi:unnamed protein product [Protopolystoma xenopodis]|uniref:Uncharacterized protein n=1 Tax=Protopolystoma xenopodis TaxID=117903 RepID=A0A3S5CCD0_9PLAT|nr:unnamed protein product [Protopolystoma xenopodis]
MPHAATQISEKMSALNQQKGATLEEMSSLVQQLSSRLNSKRSQLTPIIQELRPLRQRTQICANKSSVHFLTTSMTPCHHFVSSSASQNNQGKTRAKTTVQVCQAFSSPCSLCRFLAQVPPLIPSRQDVVSFVTFYRLFDPTLTSESPYPAKRWVSDRKIWCPVAYTCSVASDF